MDFHDLKLLLELPAVRLLRSSNAAMTVAFFYRVFKRQPRVSVPEGQLRELLQVFLEELRETDPQAFPQTAAQYLEIWCDERHGFLKKYYPEGTVEPVFELTSGTEKAIVWLESLREAEFVGTESRLESIFEDLEKVLSYASGDPDERITQLTKQLLEIQAQIDHIRQTGTVEKFTDVQIRERFSRILTTARELLGDFRQVEENFKRIAQEIAERHSQPGVTKGAIVGHLLDSHDALRQSAQGQSFFAFWELLLSQERQSQFHQTVDRVYAMEAVGDELRQNRLLQHLIPRLLNEGEKVVGSHQRMSANLRRVLDTVNLQERRRVLDLIREIQTAALAVKDAPPDDRNFFEVEDFPEIFNTMSRQLWQPSDSINLSAAIEVADNTINREELLRFRNLPQVQLRKLKANIESCLMQSQTVTLENVLDAFPPKHGMIEVLGYLVLATKENRHYVGDDTQTIELHSPNPTRWRVPRVLFCKA